MSYRIDLSIMYRWEYLNRFVKALHFALFIEEAILVALGDKEVELEVSP